MAAVITRSSHPDLLWPGVLLNFGLNYDELPTIWTKVFSKKKGTKFMDKLVENTGFGLARKKPEGTPIQYDSDHEGYVTQIYQQVIALGYMVTREELEDNLYAEVSDRRSAQLAFSMHTTIELTHANVFLNGFSSSYPIGDGQPFFSASHPTDDGTQSNLPTVNADLSESSLEDMCKRIMLAKNSRGLPISLAPKMLMVSAADSFNAERILGSTLQTNTANNNINAVKAMGMIPEGALVNQYLGVEATGAWYLQTNLRPDDGTVSIWRREVELERDNDFDTENAKAKATARFNAGVGDWRCWYAAQGV